jgi:DNA gyrase/topoisomerase IV subunit A
MIPVRTVSGLGNFGSRDFPEPSEPQYTLCRQPQAGQLILDAEARRLAPVPVGLINGTSYRGGTQPPLEPFRVLAALRQLLEHPRMTNADLLRAVGPPYSVTGCDITGDLDALIKGRRTAISQTGRIIITGVPVPEPSGSARTARPPRVERRGAAAVRPPGAPDDRVAACPDPRP